MIPGGLPALLLENGGHLHHQQGITSTGEAQLVKIFGEPSLCYAKTSGKIRSQPGPGKNLDELLVAVAVVVVVLAAQVLLTPQITWVP